MYKNFYIPSPVLPVIKQRRLENLKRRRKLWLKAHLWLGLGLGLILALIGLTGSVLVFWQEIDAALNSGLYRVAGNTAATSKSLDEIFTAARRHAPPGWESGYAKAPEDKDGNYVFHFYYPESSPPPEAAESLNIAIDPYTAELANKRVFYHGWNPFRHCFVGFFFKLHYALFLGKTGVTLVGLIAMLLIVSVLSGLILWWPLDGKWKRVLTIKPRAGKVRFNHDLHQTAGFYTVLVMLVLLISGIYFNLGEEFRWLVERFSPLTPEATVSARAENQNLLSLDQSFTKARQRYPGGIANFYSFPNQPNGPITACYKDVAELRSHVLDSRCLVIDPATGDILQVRDAAHGSKGDVFMQWQWPLHSGQAFGWTGRLLVFITGLVCPLLFVTGVIRWLQKRRAERQKPKRAYVSSLDARHQAAVKPPVLTNVVDAP
jgi:uncharacterized iron-regulated membrane protein